MAADGAFIAALRAALAAQADAARAAPMQAYMKSAMPYRGIPTPLRRRLVAGVVQRAALADAQTLADTMAALWRQAAFREERYAAMELARVGPHARLARLSLLPVYEEMIATGAWWDYCDDISGNGIGTLLQRWPDQIKPVVRCWARGDDLWLRRAAMLCQRRLKAADFDAVLFYEVLLRSLDGARFEREFFIQKGLGWALRERSYAAPDEVRAFCRETAARLSPLTLREALKAIVRKPAAGSA